MLDFFYVNQVPTRGHRINIVLIVFEEEMTDGATSSLIAFHNVQVSLNDAFWEMADKIQCHKKLTKFNL